MNSRQNRIARRADDFYNWFKSNVDEYISLFNLCTELGCSPGKLSRAAIRATRRMAKADGWQFPPAVPATHACYVLTKDPTKLLSPALHMGRIKAGVSATEKELLDYMRNNSDSFEPGRQGIAAAYLAAHEFKRKVLGDADTYIETVTQELVKAEREIRADQVS